VFSMWKDCQILFIFGGIKNQCFYLFLLVEFFNKSKSFLFVFEALNQRPKKFSTSNPINHFALLVFFSSRRIKKQYIWRTK
jgi:hypothetical protein